MTTAREIIDQALSRLGQGPLWFDETVQSDKARIAELEAQVQQLQSMLRPGVQTDPAILRANWHLLWWPDDMPVPYFEGGRGSPRRIALWWLRDAIKGAILGQEAVGHGGTGAATRLSASWEHLPDVIQPPAKGHAPMPARALRFGTP